MVRDIGPAARTLSTLLLVVAADLLLVGAAAFLLGPWAAALAEAALRSAGVPGAATLKWVVVLVPALAAFLWAQLRYTRRETLAAVDARPVSPESHPDLHARVTRLAAQADLRAPSLAVAETAVANSLTVGTPRNATVAVSTGLLDALSDDELDAVLAHELAHVKNRDVTVMTLATFLPAVARGDYSLVDDLLASRVGRTAGLVLGAFALFTLYALNAAVAPAGSMPASLGGFALALLFTALVGGIVLGALAAPVVLLSASLSRHREFVADRAGARMASSPAALAGALRSLDADAAAAPTSDARATVRGLCLLPHGFGGTAREPSSDRFAVETESHPPTAERIDRLRALTAEVETARR